MEQTEDHKPPTDIMEVITSKKGRRSKCTPELIEEISYHIAVGGLTQKDAAAVVGIDISAVYRYMKRGREEFERINGERTDVLPGELNYYDFYNALTKAIPHRKETLLMRIAAHGERSWQPLAWLLERQYPEDYAKKTKVEISDWRSELINLIKQGVDFDVIAEEFGEEEAKRLYVKAGMGNARSNHELQTAPDAVGERE